MQQRSQLDMKLGKLQFHCQRFIELSTYCEALKVKYNTKQQSEISTSGHFLKILFFKHTTIEVVFFWH